jgi:hypothetical protein
MWEILNVMVYVGMFLTAGFAIYGFSQLISSNRIRWEQELIRCQQDRDELEEAIRNQDYSRVPGDGVNSLGLRYGLLNVYGEKFFGEDALSIMLSSRIDITDKFRRSLEFWSKKRWKVFKMLSAILVVFVLFAALGGRPDISTWRAANIVKLACENEMGSVRANLPMNFSFGTDYTDETVFPALAKALNRLSASAEMAQSLDAKHFQYFYNEIELLRSDLDGSAVQDDIHNPQNIMTLNLNPFCEANLQS